MSRRRSSNAHTSRAPRARHASTPSPRTGWWWPLIFALAAFAAFAPALHAPFEFDDYPAIQQNATIRDLASPAVLHPPADTPVAGRPLANTSLALNYALNDGILDNALDPAGYRFVNILLHIACGVLLFLLLRRTLVHIDIAPDSARTLAGITTLLWLVHPLQTETVDYVIQRTEILVSLFYVATLLCADRAADATSNARRAGWYTLALVACLAGAASKEVMATAPVMLVLYDRTFRSPSWRAVFADRLKIAVYAAAFTIVGIFLAFVTLGARSRSVGFTLGVSSSDYAFSQGYAIARYLQLLVWPSGLNFDYGDAAFHGARVLVGIVIVAALLAASVMAWLTPRTRAFGFAGLWFFILLAPSSSLIPIRTEIAAERRVYLAIAALIAAMIVGAYSAFQRYGRRVSPTLVHAVAVALPCAMIVVSVARDFDYRSQESLYRDVVAKTPGNPRAHVGVGLALMQQGPESSAEAIREFRTAIALDSSSFLAWQTLGVVSVYSSDWSQARDAFRHAMRIEPANLDAAAGMARAYLGLQQPDSALPYVRRVGDADPEAEQMLYDELAEKRRLH